jgi:Na+-translocating ferredoxin:NAD+ oxidoreductase RnfG subunit
MSLKWTVLLPLPDIAIVAPAYAVDYLTVGQAQKVLFPDADSFAQQQVELTKEQLKAIKSLAGVRQRDDDPEIWQARKAGQPLGWFVVDEVVGKHEYITYAVAASPDGHVLGIEVMTYRETHGDEIRRKTWRDNFDGKTLADPLKLGKDIPNISGATLSCRNVTDGVKRVLSMLKVVFGNG